MPNSKLKTQDSKLTYLVTGTAGFIGFYISKRLLEMGEAVIGIDNLNKYYDPSLKEDRLNILRQLTVTSDRKHRPLTPTTDTDDKHPSFVFYKTDLVNYQGLKEILDRHPVDKICHMAAQAGVRYSLENPFAYQRSNLEGFLNIIELAKEYKIKNFVYASSSSVYGKRGVSESVSERKGEGETPTLTLAPFKETDNVDHPISFYAATKKADELIAYAYAHLYGLPTIGLRFFTVYGPWGRPDMALFIFTKAILEGREINVYNYGKMKRDFTYIDDIVDGVIAACSLSAPVVSGSVSTDTNHRHSSQTQSLYEIFNLGNSHTVELEYFIECIERELGKRAKKRYLPLQKGDVPETFADISYSKRKLGFEPRIGIEEGIKRFVRWYTSYYKQDKGL